MIVAWPERIVLGVIGRRVDPLALAWAHDLAQRWSADLSVIAGYHPPVAMYPHIVTARERADHRAAIRRKLVRRVEEATGSGAVSGERAVTRVRLVPDNQLAHVLVRRCLDADLLLFSLSSTGVPLLTQRQEVRAQKIARRASCPASLGPGRMGAAVGA